MAGKTTKTRLNAITAGYGPNEVQSSIDVVNDNLLGPAIKHYSNTPCLTIGEVAEFLGIPAETLRSWIKRGVFLLPESRKSGRGTRQLLTGFDCMVLAGMHQLSTLGVPLDVGKVVAESIEDRITDVLMCYDEFQFIELVVHPIIDGGGWGMLVRDLKAEFGSKTNPDTLPYPHASIKPDEIVRLVFGLIDGLGDET